MNLAVARRAPVRRARAVFSRRKEGTVSETFSRGFDHGNYASAYVTEDPTDALGETTGDLREGILLGFYSSYELHEISEEYREEVRALRIKWKEEL